MIRTLLLTSLILHQGACNPRALQNNDESGSGVLSVTIPDNVPPAALPYMTHFSVAAEPENCKGAKPAGIRPEPKSYKDDRNIKQSVPLGCDYLITLLLGQLIPGAATIKEFFRGTQKILATDLKPNAAVPVKITALLSGDGVGNPILEPLFKSGGVQTEGTTDLDVQVVFDSKGGGNGQKITGIAVKGQGQLIPNSLMIYINNVNIAVASDVQAFKEDGTAIYPTPTYQSIVEAISGAITTVSYGPSSDRQIMRALSIVIPSDRLGLLKAN